MQFNPAASFVVSSAEVTMTERQRKRLQRRSLICSALGDMVRYRQRPSEDRGDCYWHLRGMAQKTLLRFRRELELCDNTTPRAYRVGTLRQLPRRPVTID